LLGFRLEAKFAPVSWVSYSRPSYGAAEQQRRWLAPLLAGEIRSAFAMTEPDTASSDATNIGSSIVRSGEDYVITGRKWYSTGASDPRCKISILMGKSSPDAPEIHSRQSPRDAHRVRVIRALPVL
jgi:acyl-CoA dehydrogenase